MVSEPKRENGLVISIFVLQASCSFVAHGRQVHPLASLSRFLTEIRRPEVKHRCHTNTSRTVAPGSHV